MKAIFAAAALILLSTGLTTAVTEETEDFTPLFDGKTFEGWEGNLDIFRIEDGAIVGGSLKKALSHNEFLCTKKEYSDFELRLQFKLEGNLNPNAGVQIRTKRIPDNTEVIGYQADMADGYWGVLWEESGRGFLAGPSEAERGKPVKKGDWNRYRIRCQGNHVELWLNDVKTVDYTEADSTIPATGVIGLQIHSGAPAEVRYKDIMIKELPAP